VPVSGSGYLLSLIEGNSKVKLYQLEDIYSSADGSLEPHPLYKNQYAVVVGIDRYRRLSIPKLSSGVEDAKGVARVLKDRGFKVIELYNESATRDTILDALKRVKLLAKSGRCYPISTSQDMGRVSGYNVLERGYYSSITEFLFPGFLNYYPKLGGLVLLFIGLIPGNYSLLGFHFH